LGDKTHHYYLQASDWPRKSLNITSLFIFSIFSLTPVTALGASLLNHGLFDDTDTGPQALKKIVTKISPIIYGLALVMIILGGIIMFTSVGIPARFEQGKKMILSAFLGAIMFSAFWLILSFIGINFT